MNIICLGTILAIAVGFSLGLWIGVLAAGTIISESGETLRQLLYRMQVEQVERQTMLSDEQEGRVHRGQLPDWGDRRRYPQPGSREEA